MGSFFSCECYKYNKARCDNCNAKYCTKCHAQKTGHEHKCKTSCCQAVISPFKDHFCKCYYCKQEHQIQSQPNKALYKCVACKEKHDSTQCKFCGKLYYELPHFCNCALCNATMRLPSAPVVQPVCEKCKSDVNYNKYSWKVCSGCKLEVCTEHKCKCYFCASSFTNKTSLLAKCDNCLPCSRCNRAPVNANSVSKMCLQCEDELNMTKHNYPVYTTYNTNTGTGVEVFNVVLATSIIADSGNVDCL